MKNKIMIIGFITILAFFSIYSFILVDEEISFSERRKLTSFPKVSVETIFDGSFFEKMNKYLVDHFPNRDEFRQLKGIVSDKLMNKKENNGIFIKDDTIYQLNANINKESIHHFTTVLNQIDQDYLKSDHVYYSIIPDKNYYLENKKIPKMNYKNLFKQVDQELNDQFEYIDITEELNQDSYYRTDIHWDQEKILSVSKKLSSSMNNPTSKAVYEKKKYDPFYGALYGRIASSISPDTITYLTNDEITQSTVYHYEKQTYEKIYEEKNLKNVDSYDIFLSGATPLMIIENPKQTSGKELILFRDSFGSSIAPLLIEHYSKITLIDLRYLNRSLLGKIDQIDFKSTNQDILFLYSVPIINNSFTLK